MRFPWGRWAVAAALLLAADAVLWWLVHATSGDGSRAYLSAASSLLVAIVALLGSAVAAWWAGQSVLDTERRASLGAFLQAAETYYAKAWDVAVVREKWRGAKPGSQEKEDLGELFEEDEDKLKEHERDLRFSMVPARMLAKPSDENSLQEIVSTLLARGEEKSFDAAASRRLLDQVYKTLRQSKP